MLKRISRIYSNGYFKSSEIRVFSTAVEQQQQTRGDRFRCPETNPVNHSPDNIGQFYSLPKKDENQLFTYGGLTDIFTDQCRTFTETCVMIRKPAIDIIHSLKNLDYSKPAYRFLLYGLWGSGKSMSLAHVVHYGYKAGFLVVHVPWVGNWMRRCKESSTSVMDEDLTDLNIDAAMWLTHFKTQNAHLLNTEAFKVDKEYLWSKREKTAQGAPLTELIDFGINRIKYASQCVVVLAEEIKRLSMSGTCRTLVVIDGFNAFFYPKTRVFKEHKEVVPPHKVTLTRAFLNLSSFDWSNAAVILSVDERAAGITDSPSHLPRYLLGKEGFEHVDPFVPIPVGNYNEKEFLSCIEYYKERRWIQQYYPGLEDELGFVSNYNPLKLVHITAPL